MIMSEKQAWSIYPAILVSNVPIPHGRDARFMSDLDVLHIYRTFRAG